MYYSLYNRFYYYYHAPARLASGVPMVGSLCNIIDAETERGREECMHVCVSVYVHVLDVICVYIHEHIHFTHERHWAGSLPPASARRFVGVAVLYFSRTCKTNIMFKHVDLNIQSLNIGLVRPNISFNLEYQPEGSPNLEGHARF